MKTILSILVNATVLCVLWIISTLLANAILQVEPATTDNASSALLLMWLCCLIEAAALHLYIINNRQAKWQRAILIFGSIFLFQFAFTQIESLYFIDQEIMPSAIILNTVAAGFVTSFLFTAFLSWRYPIKLMTANLNPPIVFELLLVTILGVIIYPMLYFTAGYFIAWQSEVVRIYYSGTADLYSFAQVIKSNFQSGVYTLQALRGLLWAGFGVILLRSLRPTGWITGGTILGLLFASLMTAQLLIPNPYMPTDIRLTHLIETASSNFVWGIVISFTWFKVSRNTSYNTTIIEG